MLTNFFIIKLWSGHAHVVSLGYQTGQSNTNSFMRIGRIAFKNFEEHRYFNIKK